MECNLAITPVTTTLYNYFCREERPEAHKDAYNYVALFAVVVPAAAFPVKFILKIFLINYIDANSVIFFLFSAQIFYTIIRSIYAPLSLHEMMGTQNEKLMHYVQDYQIHLIDPAKLTEEDLKKFTSSLREVIEYIKYSKDKEKLSRILKDNSRMLIDREAALVIKTITNTAIEISEKEEKIDMCKAIDDMLSEREAKGEIRGIEIGEFRMLVKQVKKGRLTIEEAAEDAAMSVEEFRNVTDDMLKEG